MKTLTVVTQPAIICPINKDLRSIELCKHCDAHKGNIVEEKFVTAEPRVTHIQCAADEY